MSVILQSSGGGQITLQEPTTASNFTQTLPAVNGTIITTGNRPTGSVLQVVQATTTTGITINTSTYTDTNLTASITPSSTSSRILVIIMQPVRFYNQTATGSTYGGIRLMRDATAILTPITDATGPYQLGFAVSSNIGPNVRSVWNCSYIDSPATTSSVTYKTQARRYNSDTALQFQEADTVNNTSTIVLMEIA